jgi:hypothetical protein
MRNDDTNVNTSGVLPADFDKQAKDDEQRHKQADEVDQSGELDPLGEDQDNKPLEIDEEMSKLGLQNDDKGPHDVTISDDLDAEEQ